MDPHGAYSYYPYQIFENTERATSSSASSQTTTDNARGSSAPSNESLSMSRDPSYGSRISYSSSSTAPWDESFSPATPHNKVDMSSWYSYDTAEQVEAIEKIEYNDVTEEYTNSWYADNAASVPPNYYDDWSVNNEDYVVSPMVETPETSFRDSVPRITPAMPSPSTASATVAATAAASVAEKKAGSHVCLVSGCTSKTMFVRKADLQRHYDQVHRPADQKKHYLCDYQRCERSRDAFHRMDHFRDHYRDFHKEDLPRKTGESAKWYKEKEKNVSKKSWRCVKCLTKVSIKDYDFQCQCGTTCETPRRNIRGYS